MDSVVSCSLRLVLPTFFNETPVSVRFPRYDALFIIFGWDFSRSLKGTCTVAVFNIGSIEVVFF